VPSLRAAGNVADELATTVVLADMWVARGRPTQARRLLERALLDAGARGDPTGAPTADLHVALSALHCESGALDTAREHLQASAALGEAASLPENRYRRFAVMARLRYLLGDPDGAIELLEEAKRRYRRGFFPDVRPIAAVRARIRIGQGALKEASAWAHERRLTPADELDYLREFEHLTLVRLLIAQHQADPGRGRIGAAVDLLDRMLGAAETSGRGGTVNEILVLLAVAHQTQGRPTPALASLQRALVRAEPEDQVRLFLDEGTPMVVLLRRAATERIAPRFVSRLLRASERHGGPAADQRRVETATVQLSGRELEVLRLLDSSLSGPEVARQLFVSLNTLRTHTRHIFDKLQVNSRADAVRRAREQGLI
jgi:LuxR family maltose regulon positive regulatory protein